MRRGSLLALLAIAFIAACAPRHPAPAASRAGIGPWPAFDGRLIVIEPARRWQALMRWNAPDPERGEARFTHAASGLVVEIRWHGKAIQLRDSRQRQWRPVPPETLARLGIWLPPRELAALLLGRIPPDFHAVRAAGRNDGARRWQARRNGRLLRIEWLPAARKLRLVDVTRGASATLILPAQP